MGKNIVVYTDGACSGNPGPGGWAVIITGISPEEIILSGGEKETTNNRMELTAAIRALEYLSGEKGRGAVIYTDSQYVRNGILTWIQNWKKNGWKTAKKEAVKNADLWRRLDQLNMELVPQWQWLKGHDGHEYNERCDQIAVQACQKFKEE